MRNLLLILFAFATAPLYAQNETVTPVNTASTNNTSDTAQKKLPDSTAGSEGNKNSIQNSRDTIERFTVSCTTKSFTCYLLKDKFNIIVQLAVPESITPEYLLEDKVNTNDLIKWFKQTLTDNGAAFCNDGEYERLADKIQQKAESMQQAAVVNKDVKIIDSLAELLADKDRIAGAFHFLKGTFPLYIKDENGYHRLDTNFKLEIPSIFIQTDYNRISTVTLQDPIISIKGLNGEKIVLHMQPVSNPHYSISLPGLNERQYHTSIPNLYTTGDSTTGEGAVIIKNDTTLKSKKKYDLYLNYSDFLHYEPYDNEMSYIIKNQNYTLKPDSITKVLRRAYSDYLSFRTFLDPLGFLGKNPNGFAQLEGDIVLPVNVKSWRTTTWFSQLHFNFNYIYNNSINTEPRMHL